MLCYVMSGLTGIEANAAEIAGVQYYKNSFIV